jgi:hypothetical protein
VFWILRMTSLRLVARTLRPALSSRRSRLMEELGRLGRTVEIDKIGPLAIMRRTDGKKSSQGLKYLSGDRISPCNE